MHDSITALASSPFEAGQSDESSVTPCPSATTDPPIQTNQETTMSTPRRLGALFAILGLLASACGTTTTTSSSSAPATTTVQETTAEAPVEDDGGAVEDPTEQAEVREVVHKFGTASIEGQPTRILTIGYSEQDAVLGLGVTPIATREWFGGFDSAVWPWAQDELGAATAEVLDMPYGELAYEQVAALQPDLIVATHAGITQEEYDLLAQIAPTIAERSEDASFGMAWEDQTTIIGEALGRSDEATQLVRTVEAGILDAARMNPSFTDATFAWANPTGNGTYWAVGQNTPPMQFLQKLGLNYPGDLADAVGDLDSLEVSAEQIDLLDTDVLLVQASAEIRAEMEADPIWQRTTVMAEDRIIWLDATDPIYGALSFSTVLSIDYLLDELVPVLAATLVGGAETGGASDDEQAALDAFEVVFDSAAAWSEKVPHLESADELETSNAAYAGAGEAMGGISLTPTAVAIEGDTATITYDVLFGGSAAYTDLSKTIERIGETWVVSRASYCDFLASARTPCS